MTTTPDDLELMQAIAEAERAQLWTCIPGYVTKQYEDRRFQAVDVAPAMRRPYRNENGEIAFEDLPTLPAVPIATIAGGGFNIKVPLLVGDPVTVICSMFSIDQWMISGEAGRQVEPRADGTHRPSGAICLPMGARPYPIEFKDYDATSLWIGTDVGGFDASPLGIRMSKEGSPVIEVLGDIHVNGSSSSPARDDKVTAALDALKDAITTAAAQETAASGLGGMNLLLAALTSPPWSTDVSSASMKMGP